MSNPWSGRFSGAPDKEFLAFSSSLAEDRLLVREDVLGSLAHAATLAEAGILAPEEHDALRRGLRAVLEELESGRAQLREDLEDVHMNVETLLGRHAGAAAGKLHTARSRNDQVALDLRLYARRGLLALASELISLSQELISKAEAHADLPMPGYTHMQPAQPVTLGHWLHAHAVRALRDAERAMDAFGRANVSPLGAAALAGTSFPIDPHQTAERLGFARAFDNSLDAVSDRDFMAESLFVAGLAAVHLSGFGEELVLYTSPAYGFLRLPDALTSGSSIMPQKRNPDAAELLRGRAGRSLAAIDAVLVTLKGLPLAYNRDLQEAKAPFVNALPYAVASVRMARALAAGLEPVPERMRAALADGFLEATELADLLAQRGMPFREAHHVVGALVKESERTGRPLGALAAEHPAFAGADVAALTPEATPARKTSPGGTSPARVREAVAATRRQARELQQAWKLHAERVERAERALLA
ncbi:MAG TPA: argininosuccinate lyase, partial [Candidatus Thermoplasmatota archaeon]|nr:argininosuccinate lyase [Candidatus Thermoplasmatota archaeon]